MQNRRGSSCHGPPHQVGGYVKRVLGLNACFKAENPKTSCLQTVFVQGQPLDPARACTAAFITSQGVPHQLGRNRRKTGHHAVAAMRVSLVQPRPPAIKSCQSFTMV